MSNASFPGYVSAQPTSFPPRPFPPVPIPLNGTFPKPSPFAHNSVANTGSAQYPSTLTQKPLSPSTPVTPLNSNSETPPDVVAAASDLEDGELSDGESSKHTKETNPGHKGSPRPSARQIDQDRQHSRKNQHINANGVYRSPNGDFSWRSPRNQERPKHHSQVKGHFPPTEPSESSNKFTNRKGSGQDTQDHWTGGDVMGSNEPPSGASYPSKISSEIQEGQRAQEARRQYPLSQTLRSDNEVRSNATAFTHGRSGLRDGYRFSEIEATRRVRDRAKTALQELYPHQIGYTKLVQEGLDSGLLLELYNEMGINVSSPILAGKGDNTESQDSASIAFKASVTGDSLNISDRQQLSQSTLHSTPAMSYNSQNAESQNLRLSTDLNLTSKQKRHEQKSEDDAQGQPVQSSQTSKTYPIISNSRTAAKLGPALPEKANLPKEASNNNTRTRSSAVVVATKDTNIDTALSSVSAGPSLKSSAGNILGAKPADKALERKDYIARMLAAKAGKPMPSSNVTAPSTTPTVHETKATMQPPPPVDIPFAGTREERRLYLGNLAFSITEDDIRALFDGYAM